ncbi:MAG: hypothetical protein R3B52_01680 [Candidatus Paceibacterota bacterium]
MSTQIRSIEEANSELVPLLEEIFLDFRRDYMHLESLVTAHRMMCSGLDDEILFYQERCEAVLDRLVSYSVGLHFNFDKLWIELHPIPGEVEIPGSHYWRIGQTEFLPLLVEQSDAA